MSLFRARSDHSYDVMFQDVDPFFSIRLRKTPPETGFTNADEAVFGTNPQDANSHFTMTFTLPSATMARLSFPTLTGRSYTIEASTDLTIWSDITTYTGTDATVVADLPRAAGETIKFYRVRARVQ